MEISKEMVVAMAQNSINQVIGTLKSQQRTKNLKDGKVYQPSPESIAFWQQSIDAMNFIQVALNELAKNN